MRSILSTFTKHTMGRVRRRTSTKQRSITLVVRSLRHRCRGKAKNEKGAHDGIGDVLLGLRSNLRNLHGGLLLATHPLRAYLSGFVDMRQEGLRLGGTARIREVAQKIFRVPDIQHSRLNQLRGHQQVTLFGLTTLRLKQSTAPANQNQVRWGQGHSLSLDHYLSCDRGDRLRHHRCAGCAPGF